LKKVNHAVLAQQNVCRLGLFTQETEAGKTQTTLHPLSYLIFFLQLGEVLEHDVRAMLLGTECDKVKLSKC
jgi:hypothetical protein